MTTGKIRWYDKEKGYGFICCNEGPDIFVHHSNIDTEKQTLITQGTEVMFEVSVGEKGPKAEKVTLKP